MEQWQLRVNVLVNVLYLDTNNDVLAFGEIIRYGRPLFNVVEDERFPIPVIIPICLTSDDIAEVTKENLGKEVKLYLYERKVS